jgi:hypothetical protein
MSPDRLRAYGRTLFAAASKSSTLFQTLPEQTIRCPTPDSSGPPETV